MNIKTSYYWKVKDIKKEALKIAISLTAPYGEYDIKITELAPDKETLWNYKADKINKKEYTEQYTKKLNFLFENKRLDEIMTFLKNQNKEILLLCYEGKYKFCHRHILAEFLNEKYKLKIEEL